MTDQPANDDRAGILSLGAEQRLVDEIGRLQAQIVGLQAHVRELEDLAHIDPLVRLPNRRGLFRELENVIARLERYGGSAAMIFVDVDGLKEINDRFGHPAGDAALIKIGQILINSLRASDIVARLAGDEFIILLLNADELEAWNMALRVVEVTLASPLKFNDHRVPLSVAVGVSSIGAGDRPHDVISRADKAMYEIKHTLGSVYRKDSAREAECDKD